MERGDVVTYDVTGIDGMHHWLYLNGRLGVIVAGPFKHNKGKFVPADSERWGVRWLLHDGPEAKDEDFEVRNYPTQFLRKIAHIDLPPDF